MRRPDLDRVRPRLTEFENHVVDELAAGRLSRRDFLRRASVAGIALPVAGYVLSACGVPAPAGGGTKPKPGGNLRVGTVTPTGAPNPALVADEGGTQLITQTGEALAFRDVDRTLKPMLATKWAPNHDGTVWTFDLRQNVRFHDGKPFSADDVVYTFDLATDPATGSNALSALRGVLSKGNVEKVNENRVAFHLDAPVGNFPYLISSDLYNTIIVPKGYPLEDWPATFIGTGAFKLEKYTPKAGATFVRNDAYWGQKSIVDRLSVTFYDSQSAEVVALLGGQVDVLGSLSAQGGQAVLGNDAITVATTRTSAYRELHLRVDQGPFTDKRVRQALALTLDRPAIISALFGDKAELGNDSPLAPIFAATTGAVPQRARDVAKARSLLAAAGFARGLSAPLVVETLGEIPAYAQLVQASAKDAGIDLQLRTESATAFYGDATFGNSDWLDSAAGIADYAGRAVPNVYLTSTLKSGGVWNAAHFANSTYDGLAAEYVAALDVQKQRAAGDKIQALLLDETPTIVGYFFNWLNPMAKNVAGVKPGWLPKFDQAGLA